MPCAFCLLPNKKSGTYRYVFSELKQKAIECGRIFSPKVIMTDFESGVLPIIKSEVSNLLLNENYIILFKLEFDVFLVSHITASRMLLPLLSINLSANSTFRETTLIFNR